MILPALHWEAIGVILVVAIPFLAFLYQWVRRGGADKQCIISLQQQIDNEKETRKTEVLRLDQTILVINKDLGKKAEKKDLDTLRDETNKRLAQIQDTTGKIYDHLIGKE